MKPFIFIPVGLFLIIWLALGGHAVGLVQIDLKQEANLGDRLYKEGAELAKKGDYKGALVKYEAGLKRKKLWCRARARHHTAPQFRRHSSHSSRRHSSLTFG